MMKNTYVCMYVATYRYSYNEATKSKKVKHQYSNNT